MVCPVDTPVLSREFRRYMLGENCGSGDVGTACQPTITPGQRIAGYEGDLSREIDEAIVEALEISNRVIEFAAPSQKITCAATG